MALTNANYRESITERERIKIMLRELEEDEVRKRTESSVEGIYQEPRKLLDLTVDDDRDMDREMMRRDGDIFKSIKAPVKPSKPNERATSIIDFNQQKNKQTITYELDKNPLVDELERKEMDEPLSIESIIEEIKPDETLMDELERKEMDESLSVESIIAEMKPNETVSMEKKTPKAILSEVFKDYLKDGSTIQAKLELVAQDSNLIKTTEKGALEIDFLDNDDVQAVTENLDEFEFLDSQEEQETSSYDNKLTNAEEAAPDTFDMDASGELNQITDTVNDTQKLFSEYMNEADSADAYTRAKILLVTGQAESGIQLLEEVGLKSYHIRYTVMACLELMSQNQKNICDYLDQVILKENSIFERLRNINKDKE